MVGCGDSGVVGEEGRSEDSGVRSGKWGVLSGGDTVWRDGLGI